MCKHIFKICQQMLTTMYRTQTSRRLDRHDAPPLVTVNPSGMLTTPGNTLQFPLRPTTTQPRLLSPCKGTLKRQRPFGHFTPPTGTTPFCYWPPSWKSRNPQRRRGSRGRTGRHQRRSPTYRALTPLSGRTQQWLRRAKVLTCRWTRTHARTIISSGPIDSTQCSGHQSMEAATC